MTPEAKNEKERAWENWRMAAAHWCDMRGRKTPDDYQDKYWEKLAQERLHYSTFYPRRSDEKS